MTSNVPTTGVAAAAQQMLANNQVNPTQAGGTPFLRYDAKRTGDWLFGPEAEVCTDDVFGLDLQSLKHGYILWHEKKANRKMVAINQPLPEPQEPIHWTDTKGKAQVSEAQEARSLEGTFEDGTVFLFEASTFGGRKAIDAMLAELFARAAANSPFLFPQVKLAADSYEHSQYGQVFEPVLTCVAWFDENGNEEGKAAIADQSESEPEQAPEPEPEQEAAPAGRRRRRRS